MVKKSFVESNYFRLPSLEIEPPEFNFLESFRRLRSQFKGRLAHGAFTEKGMWKNIAKKAKSGDIVSGHLAYGRADLPNWELRYVTLLRNPFDRAISEYFYTREGYLNRPPIRKAYLKGRPEIAAKGSLTDYLKYLCANQNRYANPATAYITGSRTHPAPFEFLKENYFHFGILEEISIFATQLAEKTNTKPCELWVNKTKTKSNPVISDEDRELLNILLQKDLNLYNQVKANIYDKS